MSVTAILTTRQLSNERTGLDIFVTGDLEGCFVEDVDKVEYTIVVVSNLDALQSSRKLQSNSTLQYSIRRTHAACEKLRDNLVTAFPHFDIPEIPRLNNKGSEHSTNACYRQKNLTKFFDFCARASALVHSKELLRFLGIIPEMEENNKQKSEKKRKRGKRSNLDLFSDETIPSPETKDSVFTESEHSSSPFDFFHRNRKKKNSGSEKSKHQFPLFKGTEIEESNNNNTRTPHNSVSVKSVENTEEEDTNLEDLEALVNSLKVQNLETEINFEQDNITRSTTQGENFDEISANDIQNYISNNVTNVSEIASLNL